MIFNSSLYICNVSDRAKRCRLHKFISKHKRLRYYLDFEISTISVAEDNSQLKNAHVLFLVIYIYGYIISVVCYR